MLDVPIVALEYVRPPVAGSTKVNSLFDDHDDLHDNCDDQIPRRHSKKGSTNGGCRNIGP